MRSKGQMCADQSIEDDAKAPDIGLEVCALVHHDFRCHEGSGPGTLYKSLAGLQKASEAEVTDLDFWVRRSVAKEDVHEF